MIDVKEYLRNVGDNIILLEKRLLVANKKLTNIYNSNKGLDRLMSADEDKEECETQLLRYSSTLQALQESTAVFDQDVTSLRENLRGLREEHENKRKNLKSMITYLKLTPLRSSRTGRKTLQQEELNEVVNIQANLEMEILKLRTRLLMVDKEEDKPSGLQVLDMKNRQNRSVFQLQQMQRLLAQQRVEQQDSAHMEAQEECKGQATSCESADLRDELQLRDSEYVKMSRQYRHEQALHVKLREQLSDAVTRNLLRVMSRSHQDKLWKVIALDATNNMHKQQCYELHDSLRREQRDNTET